MNPVGGIFKIFDTRHNKHKMHNIQMADFLLGDVNVKYKKNVTVGAIELLGHTHVQAFAEVL